jgi:hypothetical protein
MHLPGCFPAHSTTRVILIRPRSLSFPDALGPPVEPGGGANQVGTRLEGDAARGLSVFEVVDAGEMAVDERGIGQGPEVLGGLELGRIRWQEEQMHVLGHAQFDACMPACLVQDEHNLFLGAGADLLGKGSQFDFEEGDAVRRRQMKDRAAGSRVDEPDEIAPVIAMLHRRAGPPPVEAPDLFEDRLQADAMLVDGPQLDTRLGEGGRDRLDDWPRLFLNAACCSGSARTCRGRGVRRLPSRRTR